MPKITPGMSNRIRRGASKALDEHEHEECKAGMESVSSPSAMHTEAVTRESLYPTD